MSIQKERSFWLRVVFSIILLALIAVGGYLLYKAGYQHGLISAVEVDVEQLGPRSGVFAYPHARGYMPFFSLGRVLLGILFFFLILKLIRWIFFPRMWRRRFPHGPMEWGKPGYWQEMHKKMHEEMNLSEEIPDQDQDA
jgi:hypothetical protein